MFCPTNDSFDDDRASDSGRRLPGDEELKESTKGFDIQIDDILNRTAPVKNPDIVQIVLMNTETQMAIVRLINAIKHPERSKHGQDSFVNFREECEEYEWLIHSFNSIKTPSMRVRKAYGLE